MNHANSHIRTGAKESIDSDNKARDIASRLGGDPFDTKFIKHRCLLNETCAHAEDLANITAEKERFAGSK